MKVLLVDTVRCVGCRTCELRCAVERNSTSRRLIVAINEEVKPVPRLHVVGDEQRSLPVHCRHCEDAPCMTACPSGAMTRDEEGVIYCVEDDCMGCFMCVMVCPFGVIVPRINPKVIVKCDLCRAMDEPVCMASCPTKAITLISQESWPVLRESQATYWRQLLSEVNQAEKLAQ